MGCDPSRFGGDLSVIAIADDNELLPLHVFKKMDTMELTGNLIALYKQFKPVDIKVDVIGIGAGIVDRLREQGYPVNPVNVSSAPNNTELFMNLRAEIWWNLRELLDPNNKRNIIFPDDEELFADLAAVQFKYNSRGKIQIEEKEEMKKRIQRSPDRGDAVAIAFSNVFNPASLWYPDEAVTRRFGQNAYKGLI